MKKLFTLIAILLISSVAIAGDFHGDDETHTITYTIIDTNGEPVSGETVRLTVKSSDNVNYYDFSDASWDTFANITTKHRVFTEDANGGFYFTTISIDNSFIGS